MAYYYIIFMLYYYMLYYIIFMVKTKTTRILSGRKTSSFNGFNIIVVIIYNLFKWMVYILNYIKMRAEITHNTTKMIFA